MSETPPRRGRPARAESLEPTGYRVDAQTRRVLVMAQAFLDHRSLQATIDQAVREFITRLMEDDQFRVAAEALLAHQAAETGNVAMLRRPGGGRP